MKSGHYFYYSLTTSPFNDQSYVNIEQMQTHVDAHKITRCYYCANSSESLRKYLHAAVII
jgi:hypothetical protein